MTIEKLGKEKVLVDKDKLLEAYMLFDRLYTKNLDNELNFAFLKIEEAIGLYYKRTLEKKEDKENDTIQTDFTLPHLTDDKTKLKRKRKTNDSKK
jgi:hypothetical protein